MTTIVVAPDLEQAVVLRRGIFTVPAEDCLVRCNCPLEQPCQGIRIRDIAVENRTFELLAHQMEEAFLSKMRARDYELLGNEMWLHGPFWSYDFNRTLQDAESSIFRGAQRRDKNGDEHPEYALPVVFERDTDAFAPYRDYLVVGNFLKQAVLTEVIVPDGV